MAERLGQVIYWISCGIAAVGVIGAVFWIINGALYEGDEVAFTIAAIFSVFGVVSYLIGRAVLEGRFLRKRFGDVALWLSDLVDRYRFRDEKKQ
jgi:hypothetical protein